MSVLLHSKAFWSALIAFVGVVVMRFTQVPPEIWQSFVGLASAVVLAFLGEEIGVSVGKGMSRAFLDFRKAEDEKLALKGWKSKDGVG